jgi:hypothetical protein
MAPSRSFGLGPAHEAGRRAGHGAEQVPLLIEDANSFVVSSRAAHPEGPARWHEHYASALPAWVDRRGELRGSESIAVTRQFEGVIMIVSNDRQHPFTTFPIRNTYFQFGHEVVC